jgi:hypothetical protein
VARSVKGSRFGVALLCLSSSGCGGRSIDHESGLSEDGRGGTQGASVEPGEDEPVDRVRPVPDPMPLEDPAGFALVATCNDECNGCDSERPITRFPMVVTTLAETGEEVIRDSRPPDANGRYDVDSASCRAYVRLRTRIRVGVDPGDAHFLYWESPSRDGVAYQASCTRKCFDEQLPCEFDVTERTYCGAFFLR